MFPVIFFSPWGSSLDLFHRFNNFHHICEVYLSIQRRTSANDRYNKGFFGKIPCEAVEYL